MGRPRLPRDRSEARTTCRTAPEWLPASLTPGVLAAEQHQRDDRYHRDRDEDFRWLRGHLVDDVRDRIHDLTGHVPAAATSTTGDTRALADDATVFHARMMAARDQGGASMRPFGGAFGRVADSVGARANRDPQAVPYAFAASSASGNVKAPS
jgi:hypothetical protein